MAAEKRSFPFSELDIPTTHTSENKWKRQCISSDFLKRHDKSVIGSSLMDGITNSPAEEASMEYENCTDVHHQNGQIAFRDLQNGYDPHVDIRFKNGYSLQANSSIQNGHSLNSDCSIQNGHSLLNETSDNNNSISGTSVCIRCQAGEPGHIGHIGR
ncbi:uncharacterized protein LOC128559410 [Mercenaria mercenaria]|uniref:uncharacterized protein LOC128559410 n=1 Tax=Mercenaria mercenaria TaxID=6596 RepID=UPI00234F9160|nr:uncharacterized protein LOC128559410 [Mercenaria mercenaria]